MSLINHHEFLDMCKMYKWNQVIKIAKENPELLNNTINNRWPPLKQALYYNLYKIIEDNDFDDKIISELLILGANPNYNHNDISILNWIKMKQDKLNKLINILENCYINNNTESNNKCIINISNKYKLSTDDNLIYGNYYYNNNNNTLYDADNNMIGIFNYNKLYKIPFDFTKLSLFNIKTKLTIKSSEIMEEIQNPLNNLATFVLASQLNGAEYPSHNNIIKYVQNYIYDNTAGPRGQLAGHPGVAQFLIDNASNDNNLNGINSFTDVYNNMHNILSKINRTDIINDLYVKNGYLKLPNNLNNEDEKLLIDTLYKSLHNLKSICMFNVPSCGLDTTKNNQSKTKHSINYIYASAIPVNSYINKYSSNVSFQELFSNIIITGQYFGAYKNVIEHNKSTNKNKIYLSPLGGGVFNNNYKSICDAIINSIKLFELLYPEEINKLDIYLLLYNKQKQDHDIYYDYLKNYVKEII